MLPPIVVFFILLFSVGNAESHLQALLYSAYVSVEEKPTNRSNQNIHHPSHVLCREPKLIFSCADGLVCVDE